MPRLTKQDLIASVINQEEFELPDGSGSVLIRGLTRLEAMDATKAGADDPALLERHGMAAGMVDPPMTVDDVAKWQGAGLAHVVQAVAERIAQLSNLDDRGGKGRTSHSRKAAS
jgi:hypothetical protein